MALTAGVVSPSRAAKVGDLHFADADDRASVILGKQLYRVHCAGCHGRNLQGQPLWQLVDPDAGRRAPAFDETGYVWQHSDEEIFHVAKYGRLASGPPGAMPAFEHRLEDDQILAVIAFIKARWPVALRVLQAMHNPGLVGMPSDARDGPWLLPPNCNAVLRRSEAAGARSERLEGNRPGPAPRAERVGPVEQ